LNGLHLNIRQTDFIVPLKIPYLVNAWAAYSEHEGKNLQEGGKSGDMNF
jgi:hypothetical protein